MFVKLDSVYFINLQFGRADEPLDSFCFSVVVPGEMTFKFGSVTKLNDYIMIAEPSNRQIEEVIFKRDLHIGTPYSM